LGHWVALERATTRPAYVTDWLKLEKGLVRASKRSSRQTKASVAPWFAMDVRTSSFGASRSGSDHPVRPHVDHELSVLLEHHYALPVVVELRRGSAYRPSVGQPGDGAGGGAPRAA
jgi:hypothetical protein